MANHPSAHDFRHPDQRNPCQLAPADRWFPEPRSGSSRAAKHACLTECLNRAECLAYALEHHVEHGLWGGMTHKERLAWARANGTARPAHRPRKAAA